ncbi:hypothetical protein SUGI_0588850 [Cryptomeria japonica]|nr:hypothetical protein SUGI_0588850 [Cryptomeria japonica]
MANIFKSAGVDLVRGNDLGPTLPSPNSPPAGNHRNNIRCNSESPTQVQLKRREILVASTSMRVPATGLLMGPIDQVSSLTDYHNLQNAQKLKFKYASDIDVGSLFPSSDGEPCNGLPVEARVTRPAFSDEFRGRQEELVIQGIKVCRQTPLWFDVCIRALGRGEKKEYYCGSFIHMPPRQKISRGHQQKRRKRVASCSLRLGIGQLIEKMDGEEQTSVIVTLVPRLKMDQDPISVESIRIDYS